MLLAGLLCACGSSGPSTPAGPQFSFALASSSVAAFPSEPAAKVGITVTRSGSTASLTASVAGLPAGASTTIVSPGGGAAGSIAITAGTAAPGAYALTVSVTDGAHMVTEPLSLMVGVTAVVGSEATGTLQEAMSTSFQIAEWDSSFFQTYPGATTLLGNLEPQHVRMQILSEAIPQTSATTWDFTMADASVQPILGVGDHSPEFQIADAPAFMYVPNTQNFVDPTFNQFAGYAANLVRYYNKGGFTVGGKLYKSPSSYPIEWWGIYNEPNGNGVSPAEYVTMYNRLVPAMQAVDPSLKFMAVELSDYGDQEQLFIPTFVEGVTAQVDVLATHFYSSCNQTDTDAQIMATIPTFVSGVQYLYSELATNPQLKNVPVWILENNVNADYSNANGMSTCNPGQKFVTDLRGSSAFFAGWRTYEFSQLGKAGGQALYHWSFDGDAQYGEFNSSTGDLQLSYWVDYWLSHYFSTPGGGSLLSVTNSDADDVEVMAVKEAGGATLVMVSDHAVAHASDNNGSGSPRVVLVDVSALGAFSTAKELTIDANTNVANGPQDQTVTYAPQMQVTLGGYGVAFLTLQ
jgi:hypothetical protein